MGKDITNEEIEIMIEEANELADRTRSSIINMFD